MKRYKVAYGGLPEFAKTIEAESPKIAALRFFSERPCRNTIFVECGWFFQETYSCEELIADIDGLEVDAIPYAIRKEEPPRKIGLVEEFLNHLVKGEYHSWR
ncbi:hypothetical protein [Pelagicoccus sp. SDUM812005]|uniref:hypothetical protein n=1 Tax=Pelagicoccus sp. SDUM812005 TaxID=3041257 RepID=UPI00280F89E6|nr:hypothetical protein [Pelagicoccus sp. SDUM812005]MDQ8181706.1 hypothetical protein [Pelagicoccus sp. SDUM812005]